MALYRDFSDRQLKKFRETLNRDNKTLAQTIRFQRRVYRLRDLCGPRNGPHCGGSVRLAGAADFPRGLRGRLRRLPADGAFPFIVLQG